MIISRTPFRISFFGGGTDFPIWYKNNSSKIINAAINKYCYVNVRKLPPFFKYKFRLRYHQTEEEKVINKIKHPTVRESLKFLNYNDYFEMIHNADLPAQSGLGASSSFTVGLLNCLHALNNRYISKKNLANKAIYVEQNKVKDFVGSQDQVAASFGGFNVIDFYGNNYKVNQIPLSYKNVKKLEESILLVFSGFSRSASKVEKKKIKRFSKNITYLNEINKISFEAEDMIHNSKNILSDFAELLNKHWYYKKKLADVVSNSSINNLINLGLKNGAVGAKILGAGDGGFILFLSDRKNISKLKKKFSNKLSLELKFESTGSQIIYYSENE
tara:strand:- start:4102 stop:5091 length:990 start_codon:yes stop_codon:yes gene_type:complete